MLCIKKSMSLILLFACIGAFAIDYKSMSTDELMSLRGSIPVEDIETYGTELSLRVKKMDEKDLIKYDILHLIKGQSTASKAKCSCSALKQRPHR